MLTETEEFLQQLKDPEEFGLRKGVQEFLDEFNHIIHSVDIHDVDNGTIHREWQVCMYAYTRGQLLSLVTMLTEYILEYAPNAKINKQQFDPETKYCGLFIQSYSVAF